MTAEDVKARRATIRRLHAEGYKRHEIAAMVSRHPRTVNQVLASSPILERHPQGSKPRIRPAVAATIVEMARDNCSIDHIHEVVLREHGPDAASRKTVARLASPHRPALFNPYWEIGFDDVADAADADPDSLLAEINLLRGCIRLVLRQIGERKETDRTRLRLMRQIAELVDGISRAFRASHVVPANARVALEELLAELGERRLQLRKGENNGA